MVAASARSAEVLLPEVRHLVDEGGEDLRGAAAREAGRVEGDFVEVGRLAWLLELRESLCMEIAIGSFVPLERDQARGELAVEESAVEMLVGAGEGSVAAGGRRWHGRPSDWSTYFVSYDLLEGV